MPGSTESRLPSTPQRGKSPVRGRIWQTKSEPGEGRRDTLFVAGTIVTALIGLTVAFVWVIGDPMGTRTVADGLEVSLGDFHFGTVGTSRARTLAFEAVAVVQGTSSEQSRYEELILSREARLAQAIEEAGRAITDEELVEADLRTFRGRIRGGVNKTLHANVVEDVVLYDFRSF